MHRYTCEKNKWDKELSQQVDWNAFGSALKSRTLPDRISTIKNICGWENVGRQKKRINKVSDKCPVCSTAIETPNHMFTCPKKIHIKEWNHCKTHLKKINTIPPIITLLHRSLLHIRSPNTTNSQMDCDLQSVADKQNELGRWSANRGYLTSQWKTVQQKYHIYFNQTIPPNKQWMTKAIWSCHSYAQNLWQYCNHILHNVNEVQETRRALEDAVKAELKTGTQGIYIQDQYLLQAMNGAPHKVSDLVLKQWILSMKSARNRYDQTKPAQPQITRFFHPKNPRKSRPSVVQPDPGQMPPPKISTPHV